MLRIKADKNENIIFFNTDKEFYDFAVIPSGNISNGINFPEINYYSDLDYSKDYLDAIANGKFFVIKDPNSEICKRGVISSGFTLKPISNIKTYIPEIHEG